MKVALGSDLHIEIDGQQELPAIPECDLVVLAGDIGKGTQSLEYAESLDLPVLFVPGNHEYYNLDYAVLNQVYKEYTHDKVHILNPGCVYIDDYIFVGATLRSSLRLPGYVDYAFSAYEKAIDDFSQVTNGDRKYSSLDHFSQNQEEVEYIRQGLWEEGERTKIVITHFLPSTQCISPRYVGSNINPYFCSNLDTLINVQEPEYWLYGHTHDALDITHSNGITKLVCNPRGYPNEKRKFSWKILDI